jgi:hypothetical protein
VQRTRIAATNQTTNQTTKLVAPVDETLSETDTINGNIRETI